MKVRELRRVLAQTGCVVDRIRGSHEIWKLPSGESLPAIVVHHRNEDVSRGVLIKVLRFLEQKGFKIEAA